MTTPFHPYITLVAATLSDDPFFLAMPVPNSGKRTRASVETSPDGSMFVIRCDFTEQRVDSISSIFRVRACNDTVAMTVLIKLPMCFQVGVR